MGGSIAITVREPDGKEHRMCRWTNTLPPFINNILLLQKDPLHAQNYLSEWNMVRADYERHYEEWCAQVIKKNGEVRYNPFTFDYKPFEYNMTLAYAPYPLLAPHGYGIVIVDMQKNLILSNQGYFYPGCIHGITIESSVREFNDRLQLDVCNRQEEEDLWKAYETDDDSAAVRFRKMASAGKIVKGSGMNEDDITNYSTTSYREIIRSCAKKLSYMDFIIDMSPFTVIHSQTQSAEMARQIYSKIKELGFTLTEHEESLWDKWIDSKK